MQEHTLQPAYVLHVRRFRETSLVIELLTARQGRCAALAKGALGSRRALGNQLQPFTPLLVAWRGRGELPLLTACETAAPALQLSERALYCGLYVNELILRLCERDDPHSGLFPTYVGCIDALANVTPGNAALEPVLRQFELALLDELGLGMQLRVDRDGEPIDPLQRYDYLPEQGPVLLSDVAAGFSGGTLLALADDCLQNPEQRREARALMRRVLDVHLGGRPLKSRELFQ